MIYVNSGWLFGRPYPQIWCKCRYCAGAHSIRGGRRQGNHIGHGDPQPPSRTTAAALSQPPHHTIPHFSVPYHTTPYHTTPYYTTQHHITPYHTTPHYTTPHYTHFEAYAAALSQPPHQTIPLHIIPYHTTPHHVIPYHTIPHHTTPYYTKHTITSHATTAAALSEYRNAVKLHSESPVYYISFKAKP